MNTGNSDIKKRKKTTKGSIIETIIMLILAAAVVKGLDYGCGCYKHWSAKRRIQAHQEAYGTVQKPTYQITCSMKMPEEFASFEYLSDVIPNLEDLDYLTGIVEKELDGFEKKKQKLEELLKEEPDYTATANARIECVTCQGSLLSMASDFGDNIIVSLYRNNLEEGEKSKINLDIFKLDINKEISEEELSKKIFKKLTGKDLPDIEISEEDIEKENIAGYHSAFEGKIAYEDLRYITNINTLLHEYGHACAQHDEELIRKIFPSDSVPIEKSFLTIALEEACAYAFNNAGIDRLYEVDKKTAVLSKIGFEISMFNLIKRFYKSDLKDNDPHYLGAELFYATRKVLKDPKEVFNYLAQLKDSNLENLLPEIKEEIKYQRNLWEESKGKISYKVELEDKMKQVAEAFGELGEKYAQHLDHLNEQKRKTIKNGQGKMVNWKERAEEVLKELNETQPVKYKK